MRSLVKGEGLGYVSFVRANARFLTFGFALAFFSSFGQTYFIGIFGDEIRAEFGLGHEKYGLLYSLATLASGLCIISIGRRIDHMDLRLYSGLVGGGLVVACVLMSLAPTAVLLTGTFFTLRLTGQGLMSHTAMTSMARYFDKERGKAMSVAGLGFPAGEAILPITGVMLIAAVGWRQSWLIIAIAIAVVLPALTWWLLVGHGERHEEHLAQTEVSEAARRADESPAPRRQWTRRDVLRDFRFYLVLPAVLAPGFIVTGLFLHQSHLIGVKGWSAAWFASCFIGFAAVQLPASLIAGPLVDRLGALRVLPVLLLPLGLSLLVLSLMQHPAAALIFLVLAGVTCGMIGPIVGALWAELYGVVHIGAIRAMTTALGVFATALSPVGMGWLIERSVSMETISLLCLGYVAIGTGLVLVVRRRPAVF